MHYRCDGNKLYLVESIYRSGVAAKTLTLRCRMKSVGVTQTKMIEHVES